MTKGSIMSDRPPLHRLFHHYSEMPYSLRTMYTATLLILALGYLFALIYLWHTYAGRATGNPMMLTYEDVVVAYSGSNQGTRLEGALHGPMRSMLPPDEVNVLLAWVHNGADRPGYDTNVAPIVLKRCAMCHDGSNPHLPTLIGYDNIKKVTELDTGADVFTLVRVSHIHMFGLTFVFFLMGTMFHHAYVRPVWFKCLVIGLPYVAIIMDISSWYFTKLFHPFAWVVIAGGALMGLCFGFMWVVTMYQMWFSRVPRAVLARSGDDPTAIV
jgi:hypothetical protein